MKKIFTLLFGLTFLIAKSQTTFTWTNADGDNDFENTNNWTPTPFFNPYPSFGDIVIFDGTVSNTDCILPNDEDFSSLGILANYTSTVDASGIDLTVVNMNLQGGSLICPSGTLHVSGNLTKAGGAAFVTSPTSLLEYNLTSTALRTVNGSFGLAGLAVVTSNSGNRIINFGAGTTTCTTLFFNGGNNPMSYRGTINVTSMLTVSGTTTSAAPSNTGTILFTGAGSKTITGTASVLQNPIGNIRFNTSGNVTMSGNLTVAQSNSASVNTAGTWSVTNIGSFTQGTSTVTMIGGTITAGNTATTQAFFDNLTIQSGSTTVFTGNSFINLTGDLTHNGTITQNTSLIRLSGSGSQAINGTASLTTINALEITNSGTKTLSHAVNLLDSVRIATGTLASGGNLTLKSTAALKGRIAQISGGGSITGNVTVETFAPGGTTDWAVLGVSGISGQSVSNWEGQIPMTCSLCPNNETSAGGYFVSIQGWDESAVSGSSLAYVEQTYNSPLSVAKGFWVFLGNGAGSTSAINYAVTGSPVTGSLPIPLSFSGAGNGNGFNLISNPYASPIRWTLLRNGNSSVANAIYVYNADLGTTTSFVGGVASHTNGCNDVIPAGQGFYVQCTSNATLTAQESNKVSMNTSANPLLRTTNTGEPNVLRLMIDGFDASHDETVIHFEPSASPSFDMEWDATKVYSSPGYLGYPGAWTARTAISSKLNNVEYSINSIPPVEAKNLVMPIVAKAYQTGQYTISPSGVENLPNGSCAILFDKVTNVSHDLLSGSYVCNINDTTNAARFLLTICAPYAAPVGITQNALSNASSIAIAKDATGALISLDFPQTTNATISVTNILGQKVIKDKTVNVLKEAVHIDLNSVNELLLITVTTDKERVTKKIIR